MKQLLTYVGGYTWIGISGLIAVERWLPGWAVVSLSLIYFGFGTLVIWLAAHIAAERLGG